MRSYIQYECNDTSNDYLRILPNAKNRLKFFALKFVEERAEEFALAKYFVQAREVNGRLRVCCKILSNEATRIV